MIPEKRRARDLLAEAGVPDPAGDLRRLYDWAYALGQNAPEPQTHEAPNHVTLQMLAQAVAKRARRQPVSQIIGKRAFWKHDFIVTPDVLDPRPDTETLVELALQQDFARVLDIGTGSGCILLSLLSEAATATGLGVDISDAALAVARANAEQLGLTSRATFLRSDWLSCVAEKFDLVVSNPPYIDSDTYATLAPELRDWEPKGALEAGADGLEAYRALAAQVPEALFPGGRVLLEIGFDQGQTVSDIFQTAGSRRTEIRQDLNGRDRVVIAQY